MEAKPLRIRFDKVDRLIKIYNGIRYLEVSYSYDINYRIYNAIFDIIISQKVVLQIALIIILEESELIYIILYLQKKKTFQNVIILIKSAANKDENNDYYGIDENNYCNSSFFRKRFE